MMEVQLRTCIDKLINILLVNPKVKDSESDMLSHEEGIIDNCSMQDVEWMMEASPECSEGDGDGDLHNQSTLI